MASTPQQRPAARHYHRGLHLGEGSRFLLVAAAAVIVIAGLKAAGSLIMMVLMAGFLAIVSYSVTDILRRYLRFPHWLAVASTVLVDFGVILGVVTLLNFLARDMVATLQSDVAERLSEKYDGLIAWLATLGLENHFRAIYQSPQDIFNVQQVVSVTQKLTGQIVNIMSTCTLVLILMTFFLGEAPLFLKNFRRLPSSAEGKAEFLGALQGIQRYLFIKTLSSALTGLLVWVLCYCCNVPFAFLWAVLAFVLNYIPTIGSIVAAIPAIVIALLLGSWADAFIVTAGYIAINCSIGNGVEPLFLGKQFGIATSVVLLSVLFWGWLWGPFGMLIAVPLTVLIKLALENSRDLAWVATIIDGADRNKRLRRTPFDYRHKS